MYLPIGLFGVSIATATTPAISRHARAGRQRRSVRKTIADGLVLMMMLNVPATVGLVVLADADRPADVRARRVHAVRHDRHGRGAAVLRDRPARLLGGPHRVARVLRARARAARRSPSASSTVLANAALNFALVQVMGYRGLALGHVDRRAAQRRAAARACCAGGSAASRAGPSPARCCGLRSPTALMGVAAAGADAFLAERDSRQRARGPAGPRRRDDRRGARPSWRCRRTCCACRSSPKASR